ncbi:hypothetical protein [Bdellovibrio sp. HCB-162]|uniref:hypothetical protein n=1 Tax=Bdellovibrio sp. HCB-162 TaxID=3394234 RepID=UPI0039BD4970
MNTKMVFAMVLISGVFVIGCSTREKREAMKTTPSHSARQVAAAEEAPYVTEFSFAKGSSELSETAKQDLRRLITDAKRNSNIKELKVISWADKEYPSKSTKKLSSAERDLVKKRNDAIRDYVKDYSTGIDVDTYSMAERPGAIKEMLNTSDARVKKSLETAGIPTTESTVKSPSKASKSIVMVITE